ncbi:MAG: PASTA domain-containing protein [Anaerolineae bacterium]|nr:PASTA domain-containing protein [Anaerolineae bacterium]
MLKVLFKGLLLLALCLFAFGPVTAQGDSVDLEQFALTVEDVTSLVRSDLSGAKYTRQEDEGIAALALYGMIPGAEEARGWSINEWYTGTRQNDGAMVVQMVIRFTSEDTAGDWMEMLRSGEALALIYGESEPIEMPQEMTIIPFGDDRVAYRSPSEGGTASDTYMAAFRVDDIVVFLGVGSQDLRDYGLDITLDIVQELLMAIDGKFSATPDGGDDSGDDSSGDDDSSGGSSLYVADLTGWFDNEAFDYVSYLGFQYTWRDEPSDSVPAGCIISMQPPGDAEYDPATTMFVFVRSLGSGGGSDDSSSGHALYVPDMTGWSATEAFDYISLLGFQYTWRDEPSDSVPAGCIISMLPPGDAEYDPATTIFVFVRSQGSGGSDGSSSKKYVSDMTGWIAAEAFDRISSLGFQYTLRDEPSDSVPAGRVVTMQPPGDAEYDPATTMFVFVRSSGDDGSAAPENNPNEKGGDMPDIYVDEFDSAPLDSMWTFEGSSAGREVAFQDDNIVIHSGTTAGGGGYILSRNTVTIDYSSTLSLEVRARVSRSDGGAWGLWGDDSNGYVGFVVDQESERLRVQVRPGSDSDLMLISYLPDVDVTDWHEYRLEVDPDRAVFFIDGLVVEEFITRIPASKPLHIRLDRVSWGRDETLTVDYVRVARGENTAPSLLQAGGNIGAEPDLTGCDRVLPPQLTVGGRAYVADRTPNNVRNAPGGAEVLGQIPPGMPFTVLEGPVCDPDAGIVWWKVYYDGLEGWTAESVGSEYYVLPVP